MGNRSSITTYFNSSRYYFFPACYRPKQRMSLWKITLAYDGTAFNGWQIQPHLPTIQGTLAKALHRISGESVLPQGSGRTDTGVHALGQVATFTLEALIPAQNLHRALNRALPLSIRILNLEAAPDRFHARHSAAAKTYEYRIFPARPLGSNLRPDPMPMICSPMLAPYVWDCPLPLDLNTLQSAAEAILGSHDFTSFAASDPDQLSRTKQLIPIRASNVRNIYRSSWSRRDGLLVYSIKGNGFLHHMVRNIVGTFVEIAAGRLASDSIPKILAAQNRSAAGSTAPARGLFLMEVFY